MESAFLYISCQQQCPPPAIVWNVTLAPCRSNAPSFLLPSCRMKPYPHLRDSSKREGGPRLVPTGRMSRVHGEGRGA